MARTITAGVIKGYFERSNCRRTLLNKGGAGLGRKWIPPRHPISRKAFGAFQSPTNKVGGVHYEPRYIIARNSQAPIFPSDRRSQTCGVRELLPIHNSYGETIINNINTQFLDFIEDQIQKQALVQAHNAETSLEDIYKDNLHFIGMTFRNSMTRSTTNSINPFDPYFDQFKEIYLKTCRRVLGSRFNRRQRLQPLTFAFIDDEGTRNHVPIRYPFHNIHLHAVMLLPCWNIDQQNLFQEVIDDERLFSIWNPNITSFDVKSYDPTKQTVRGMISYAAKGYLQSQHLERQFGSMWQRYPDPRQLKSVDVKLENRREILRLGALARRQMEGPICKRQPSFSRRDRAHCQSNGKGRGERLLG